MQDKDLFLREQDAKNIIKIIKVLDEINVSNTSISLAINSRNGNGKTYFIKRLVEYIPLQGNCKDKTLYFNAEEYDDFEDPFLPLAYHIISMAQIEDDINFLEYAEAFLVACGYAVLKETINKMFGKEINKIVSKGIDAVQDTELSNIFEEFNSYFNRRQQLSEKIKEIIPTDGKLWIFIDELDKCKPEYTVKILELIKHYFDIPNTFFLISIDLDMLACSLKGLYGSRFDVNTYVRNYFDNIYNPLNINWNIYIETKIEEFNILKMLGDDNVIFLVSLFNEWKFSIMEAEQCINNVTFFLHFYSERIKLNNLSQKALMIYLYFLILRNKYNSEYIKILHGDYILGNTRKTKYKKLNVILRVNSYIDSVLKDLANGKANENNSDLIKKYQLLEVSSISNFSKNIEWILNYSD